MAIDPTISLAVRPVQMPLPNIQSPVDQLGQVLSLRNLMQQGQSGQLELQTRQLNLDQLRRQMQEQQDYADAMRAYAQGGATVPAGAAPLQTPTVPAPPVQTAPAQSPPVGLTGGPESVPGLPNIGALPPPQPGAPLGGLMAPATAPAVTPATPTATPAMGAQAGSPRLLGMNAAQFIARFPQTGLARIKEAFALDQAEAEAGIKQHDLNFKKADAMGRYAQAIKDSKDPSTQFTSSLMEAAANGDLDPAVARQMTADGYEKHKNDIDAFIVKAQGAKDYADIQAKNLESLGAGQKNAAATIGNVTDQASYDKWLPLQDPHVQAMLGPTYHPGLNDAVRTWGIPGAELPKTQAAQQATDAQMLAPLLARNDGGAAAQAYLAKIGPDRAAPFVGLKTPQQAMQAGLTSEQQQTAAQAATTAAETAREHAETARQHLAENAIARGHLDIARRADVRAEQVYQNTYGPGANEALVGVDPKLRVQATTNAQKAADEYSKAVESTGNMQSIIDLARSGNKVAYAYAPTTGVLTINTAQGIKRVNMGAVKEYGGAGSAMDQIDKWFGKQTSGASIPDDILKNMEEVNKSVSDSAAKNYDTKLGSINQNYHSNFKPAVKGAAAPKTATTEQVKAYAQKHNISESEARKAAEAEGFVVR